MVLFLILVCVFIWFSFGICIKWFLKIVLVMNLVFFVIRFNSVNWVCILVGNVGCGVVCMLIVFGCLLCIFRLI